MQRTLFTRGFNIATSRNTQIPTHKRKHTYTNGYRNGTRHNNNNNNDKEVALT